MPEGLPTNDLISRMCSELAELQTLAARKGETEALSALVANVQERNDLEATAQQLIELTRRMGVTGFASVSRGPTPISGASGGHPTDEAWICPADPPTCDRVELPVNGTAPQCGLHGTQMRLLPLDQLGS